MNREITFKEIIFIILIGIFGFILYTAKWLNFLNSLNPLYNFLIYYIALFLILFVFSLTGFVIFGIKIRNPVQIFGTLLIFFSIFTILGWSNNYVTYTTTGAFSSNMNIYFGCEDGISWWLVYNVIGISNIFLARILAFSIIPMLTALIGTYLLTNVKLKVFDY